jgi:UDP-3-O-[3-hydroxymyristoyl] glucosamine N-acyltransferase
MNNEQSGTRGGAVKIDNALLKTVLGLDVPQAISYSRLGLIDSDRPHTLTFLDQERYRSSVEKNPNVAAVFITSALASQVKRQDVQKIVCDDPRYAFYVLLAFIAQASYEKRKSLIRPTAQIHPRAYVSDYNVDIGENVRIEPNATILPDVTIEKNSIIRAGAVVGSEGFEHKRTSRGLVSVVHDGCVVIGANVEVGAGCCIDKGFSFRQTILGEFTKLDNLVHIAHGVQIGRRCLIAACAMVAGSVTIGDDVWIGPGASLSNQIVVASGASITLGSVVVKDVKEGEHVTGHFAVPHRTFLRFMSTITTSRQDDGDETADL